MSSDSHPGPILVIDDDTSIGEFITRVATKMGLACVATETAEAFYEQYAALQPSMATPDTA